MKWITRERPKIDRVACPWLIARFIDDTPEFLFVPSDQVIVQAISTGAIPYDVQGVELTRKETTLITGRSAPHVVKYGLYASELSSPARRLPELPSFREARLRSAAWHLWERQSDDNPEGRFRSGNGLLHYSRSKHAGTRPEKPGFPAPCSSAFEVTEPSLERRVVDILADNRLVGSRYAGTAILKLLTRSRFEPG